MYKRQGFKSAPIIQDGKFVAGTGGGVCQVSTTVYNAALLSGMGIVEQHPHSLAVGYVEPSFDAMVSGTGCDLKFRNDTEGRVYILAKASGGNLCVRIYGQKTDVTYVRKSVVVETIAPPEPEIREGDSECVLRAEKQGLRSEGLSLIHIFCTAAPLPTFSIRICKAVVSALIPISPPNASISRTRCRFAVPPMDGLHAMNAMLSRFSDSISAVSYTHLFLKLCLSCFFLVFFFCYVSFAALFLLCFPERKKVLKNVLKIFMVWRSLYRGHILTIFILILSNLIQKIKTQFVFFLDFCCFWFYF